jgi:hypothetical protein
MPNGLRDELQVRRLITTERSVGCVLDVGDRTGKRSRPTPMTRLMVTMQKLKMASFCRSAVNAVVITDYFFSFFALKAELSPK